MKACGRWQGGGKAYLRILGERLLAVGVPIAALGAAWKLMRTPPAPGRLAVEPENDMAAADWQGQGMPIIAVLGILVLFVYLTLEVNTMLQHFVPGLRAGGVTLLWAAYALTLLVFGLRRSVPGLRYAGLVGFAVVTWKIFFVDLAHLDALYKIVAFIVLGVILLLAAWGYLKCRLRFQPAAEEDRT